MSSETLSGVVQRVTFENEQSGFRVLKVKLHEGAELTVVGRFQFVGAGAEVRFSGRRISDGKYGDQFRAESLMVIEPQTLEGIERYLSSGVLPGVGAGFAKKIVECFGAETLAVLDHDPGRLRDVPGLGLKRRQTLVRAWAEQRAAANALVVLQTHGISGAVARAVTERYQERAAEIVQTAPYRLALEVRGVGFKTADAIAASVGIAREHPERCSAGTLTVLIEARDSGHVYLPRAELATKTATLLQIEASFVEAAIDGLWAAGRITVEAGDVYLRTSHAAEVAVAESIGGLLAAPALPLSGADDALVEFEKELGFALAPEQKRAVQSAAEHSLVVITGGPGVGKTTIVRAILRVFERARLVTALAAPTGRAAKRMAQATGAGAGTIHRLLEYEPQKAAFARNASNPLNVGAVIVDEVSMLDVFLAEALLGALGPATRLVLVGDHNQLPSVGAGAVLKDLIDSGAVPVVVLEHIFRQAEQSAIVVNAHRVLAGRSPEADPRAGSDTDFFVIERRAPQAAADTIIEVVAQRIPARFGYDPLRDVQVLCPMHRGPAGTEALNEALQARLNPDKSETLTREHMRSGRRFRIGDRVMQLKNDYEREVFNGDLGTVRAVEDNALKVAFDEREVAYAGAELDALTLAYATTIHKSQGSEYPVVVVPFLMSHFVMLSRNLLYTAITRARQICVLIGDPRAIRLALSELKKEERYSGLARRLRG